MIYEIFKELSSELAARKVPLELVYGPESTTSTSLTRQRIVVQRDDSRPEQWRPAVGKRTNPPTIALRPMACVALVYAQSTVTGARVQDHERLCDTIVDKLVAALRTVILKRHSVWHEPIGKLLSAEELDLRGMAVWPGKVYELTFDIDRGVTDTNWDSAAAPTGAPTKITSTLSTSGNNATAGDSLPSAQTR